MTKVLNSTTLKLMKLIKGKYSKGIYLATVLALPFACSTTPKQPNNPMFGHWQNNTQGNLVGLRILSATDCELYIERAFKPRSTRQCKYEPYQDVQLLFLVGENGECGTSADYEFRFDSTTPQIDLLIGAQPIVMYKQDSP